MKNEILVIYLLLFVFSLSVSDAQPSIELMKFTGGDGPYDYGFGASSSISGDFAIVGAPLEYHNDVKCGTAYILNFNGTAWNLHSKLVASDPAGSVFFGNSVYISGNVAIVGAVGSSESGNQSGAAYIFKFNGASWEEQIKLIPSDPDAGDRFGCSVCISDDFAIVGAHRDDDNVPNSGSAYIFHFDGISWSQHAKLTANDAGEDDIFGTTVSVSGNNALIGASNNDENGTNAGAAYLFHFNGSIWNEQEKLLPPEINMDQYFGSCVSISEDYALIGAAGDDTNGTNSGAAYLYHFDGSSWTEQAILYASDAYAYDGFGGRVNISGDYAIIGAKGNDDLGTRSGSAYIFVRNNTFWTEHIKVVASDGMNNTNFGTSLGISDNFAIVGSYDALYSSDVCAAYIFGPPIPVFWTHPENQTGICIGDTISFSVSGEYFETYQWQINNGFEFQDIINGGNYSNATTNELTISSVDIFMNNSQFRCLVSNAYNTGVSDTALLTTDDPGLELTCISDTLLELNVNQTVYTVIADEFDPIIFDNNCGNATLQNSLNNSYSLSGVEIPIGSTTVEWTLSDGEISETCNTTITIQEYNPNQWFHYGEALEGDFADDNFGTSVSLNSEGTILAAGASANDVNGLNAGQAKIFQKVEDGWVQIGENILGKPGKALGSSICLNSPGNIVSVGAWGYIAIYQYVSDTWIQLGEDLEGDEYSVEFGSDISLSADGTILAVGDIYYNAFGFYTGAALVYKFSSGSWDLMGEPILGEYSDDYFGTSVSLNAEGTIIAVGATGNDENGSGSGNVRIFHYDNGTWTQIGNSIAGEHPGDASGRSVRLNSKGSIVAIGATANEDNGWFTGHVRVFKNTNDQWTQIGSDIDGEEPGDQIGASVSLNSDATLLAIGSAENDDNGSRSGHVRVFKFESDNWSKVSENIVGEAEGDQFGSALALSSSGSIVAAGAPKNDGNGNDAGHVRVFRNPSIIPGIPEPTRNNVIIYPNPTSGKVSVVANLPIINQITVFNLTGELMLKRHGLKRQEIIDLADFKTGVYIICVYTKNNVNTYKIIKR